MTIWQDFQLSHTHVELYHDNYKHMDLKLTLQADKLQT